MLSLYQPVDLSFGTVNQSIAQSHTLEVWVVAAASSSRDLNLAYDTTGYLSALTLA